MSGEEKSRVIALAAIAVTAIVGGVFFARFTVADVVLARVATASAAALLTAAASVMWGTAAISAATSLARRVVPPSGQPCQSDDGAAFADELLVGVSIFGTFLSVVAITVGIGPVSILVVTIVSAAFGALTKWRAAVQLIREIPWTRIAPLLPPIAVAFVGAITPVNTPDELVYKLAVPKLYLHFGRMLELPLNSDSYFPSSVYMTDLAPIVMSSGIGAKLLHFLLYLAVLRLVYRWSERSMFPAIVVAWTPALAIIAGWAWAEWAVIGFALLSLLRWNDFLDEGRSRDLAVAAVALGAALATKYTALPWLAVFLPLAWWRTRRSPAQWRVLGIAAAIVTTVGSFWYVRNIVWTASPVAPFLLPGAPAVSDYRSAFGGWFELVHGYDIFYGPIIDDSLGILMPALVLLSPLVLLVRRNERTVDLFVIGAVQLVLLLFIAPTSRLMTLALVPLTICGSLAATHAYESLRSAAARGGLVALAGIALAAQMLLVAFVFVTSWHFGDYLVGRDSDETYLQRTRDFPAAYAWISAHTDPSAKLLLLGENRTYYLDRRALAAGNLDGPRVAAWLNRFANPSEVQQELSREHITHVLIHKPWYRVEGVSPAPRGVLEKEYLLTVTPETDALLHAWAAQFGARVYEDPTYVIYALR